MDTPARSLADALIHTGNEAPDLELADLSWDESTLPLSLDVIAALADHGDPTLHVRLDLPDAPEAPRDDEETLVAIPTPKK